MDILIIAGNPLARMGIAALLAERDDWGISERGTTGDVLPDDRLPDVLVWDAGWEPDLSALIEVINLGITVVVLISEIADAAALWNAGAAAVLPQQIDAAGLIAAIQAADAGLTVLDTEIAEALLPREETPAPLPEDLTPRENDVLQLIAEGLANRAIAQQLEISEHTVKFHVNAIMGKLGAQSRTDAVVRAARLGLISL